MPIGNPRWLPPQVIVLTQDHMGKIHSNSNQRLSRACIVHLVIKKNNWSYVKTMSCSGSHLGITINIKNTTFVKDLGNPRWLPPQVIVLTQDHIGKIQKYILL
jgi:hypothetical protein